MAPEADMATYKSDIEIAREARMKPIEDIGAKLGIPADALFRYGPTKAKLSLDFIDGLKSKPDGKLILVTAITPTPAGEGKTTTTVGLGDGLNRIGKKAVICPRTLARALFRREGRGGRRRVRPGRADGRH